MLLLIYGIVFTNWLWTDRPMDGRTDIASYRDVLDASKNVRMYLRHSSNIIVDLWYCFH